MDTIRVIDRDGVWVTNPHAFRFADPETGVAYEPAAAYKVSLESGSWLETQLEAGTLTLLEGDPLAGEVPEGGEGEKPKPKSKAKPAA